jgi:hypothetical protein
MVAVFCSSDNSNAVEEKQEGGDKMASAMSTVQPILRRCPYRGRRNCGLKKLFALVASSQKIFSEGHRQTLWLMI